MKLAALVFLLAAQLCLLADEKRLKMGPYQWLDKPERINPMRVSDGKTNWVCGLWQWEDEHPANMAPADYGYRFHSEAEELKRPLRDWFLILGEVVKVTEAGEVMVRRSNYGEHIDTLVLLNVPKPPKVGERVRLHAQKTGRLGTVKFNGRERELPTYDYGAIPAAEPKSK